MSIEDLKKKRAELEREIDLKGIDLNDDISRNRLFTYWEVDAEIWRMEFSLEG